jgi:hypothetical protein
MIARIAIVAAVALVACGGSSNTADNDLDVAPLVTVEEILRIGSVDDPDYGFTGINGVDVDRDGRIWVFEATDMQFRVYAPDGTLVRRVGGRGEGPGEFRDSPRFGIVGDTVWAIETFGRRLSLFRRDGTHLSTVPIQVVSVPLQRNVGLVMPVQMRDDGLFTSDLTVFTSSRDVQLAAESDTVPVPRVLYNSAGIAIDTVGWVPQLPPAPRTTREQVMIGGNRYYIPQPPADAPLSITVPDGRIVVDRPTASSAEPAAITITRLDLAGDTVWRRSYSYHPRPFTEAALDTTAWRTARTPGGGIPIINGVPVRPPTPADSMEVFHHLRGAMSFPSYQSPVRGHRLGNDGSLWLTREDEAGSTQRWSIIDARGSALGTVDLPRSQYPIRIDGDTFFVIDRDEFDVPWLVQYRLRIE